VEAALSARGFVNQASSKPIVIWQCSGGERAQDHFLRLSRIALRYTMVSIDRMSIIADDALALQRLYHWERTAPNQVALTQPMGDGKVHDYRWSEMLDRSRRMAAHLRNLGLRHGDRIGIFSKNTAHWLLSDYAIFLAGGVSVPLYPTLAPGTIRQILEHSECKLLFVGKLDGWEHMQPGVPTGLACISHPLASEEAKKNYPQWDEIVANTAPLEGEPVRPSDDLATIIYTSGTTGTPKGVMHCFAAFAWAVRTAMKRVPLNGNTRMLSYLPLAHVVERALVEFGQLESGMHVFFAESLQTFTADMQRARPTVFFSVPRLWVKFQQGVLARMPAVKLDRLLKVPIVKGIVRRKILAALGLDQCTFAVGGAAPMPLELLRWYAKLGLIIGEGYGMTENLAASHMTLPGKAGFGTVGQTYEGVQCRLESNTGEIQVRSPATMLGYYKQPELTKLAFTDDGWLHTGDKGTLDAAGNLKITGRVKDMFKTSKGKYIAPAPIEDKLVMHAAVEACCVTGANLGQPIGLMMLNDGALKKIAEPAGRLELESSLAEHLKGINSGLDPHERLSCLVVMTEAWTVDNDLITPTLKVKRNRIEDLFARYYETWSRLGKRVVWHGE
jgi:long-chain acyl-CoA synthetase